MQISCMMSDPICWSQPLQTVVARSSFLIWAVASYMSERKQHIQALRRGARAHGVQQMPDNAVRERVKAMAQALMEANCWGTNSSNTQRRVLGASRIAAA